MSRRSLNTLALGFVMGVAACSDASQSTAPSRPASAEAPSFQKQPAIARSASVSSPGWHEQARTLVGQANMSPLAAARVYAALGVAQYRAIRAMHDVDHGAQKHAFGVGGWRFLEQRRGAVAGASAAVLTFLFPSAASNLEARVATEENAGRGNTHPHFERGVAVGRAVGAAMVDYLKNDRFTVPWTGTVPTGPGMWIANGTPAGGTFSGVTPYFLTSADQFRPAPPPAFASAAFLTDLAEIKALSDNRTPEQRAIALQWNYATGTMTPPGYWNQVTSQYIAERGLDDAAATRVYALTGAAMMDALIACWEAKYHYWMIRPTQAQPAITLVFALPNHPSYPSGHSCVSSAAATTLGTLFPKHAAELQDQVTEAGLSRMYAGIHYRFDIDAGAKLGADVAHWALSHRQRLE